MTELRADDIEGTYYDAYAGDMCRVEAGGCRVTLYDPVIDAPYHNMTVKEWEEQRDDFYEIPQRAAENPVEYLEERMADLIASSDDMGLRYADYVTELTRMDD